MRKLIISLLAVSLLVVMPLAAQTARTQGMVVGANDVEDIGNVATFPELALKYGDTLYVENVDSYAGGYLYKAMGDYVVGLGLIDNYGDIIYDGAWVVTPFGLSDPNTLAQLSFAAPMGGANVGAAVQFGLASYDWSELYSNNQDPNDKWTQEDGYEGSSSLIGFQVGGGMEEVGPLSNVDVSLGLQMTAASGEYNDNPASNDTTAWTYNYLCETDGVTAMDINVLAVHPISDATTLRYQVGFATLSSNVNSSFQEDANGDGDLLDVGVDSDDSSTEEFKGTQIGLRVASNTVVNDDDLLIGTVGLLIESYEDTLSQSTYAGTTLGTIVVDSELNEGSNTYLTLGLAGEGNLSDNVAVRCGVEKYLNLWSETNTDDEWDLDSALDWVKDEIYENEENEKYVSDVYSNAGMTLKAGNWVIDAELDVLDMLADCFVQVDATLNF